MRKGFTFVLVLVFLTAFCIIDAKSALSPYRLTENSLTAKDLPCTYTASMRLTSEKALTGEVKE